MLGLCLLPGCQITEQQWLHADARMGNFFAVYAGQRTMTNIMAAGLS
jgi:hypothetical protein